MCEKGTGVPPYALRFAPNTLILREERPKELEPKNKGRNRPSQKEDYPFRIIESFQLVVVLGHLTIDVIYNG